MEPLTHFLTGACIGRAGFNRKTAFATAAAVMAAEAADLDIVWTFAGPVEDLKHHRGITHTLIGAPAVAAVVVGAVWLLNRWWRRKESREHPVRWGWLCLTALVAALSHILLDWTNNYGVRPFFPFNPRWYAGSIVFIAEPIFWALLVIALAMPWLLGLADREIGVKKQRFRGRGWAIFALAGMFVLGCWRMFEYSQGLEMLDRMPVTQAPVIRVALEPYPVNPYRWHAIVETPEFFQTAELNTREASSPGGVVSDPSVDVLYKPPSSPALEAAKRTLLGRVYLDWGTWAMVRDLGPVEMPALKAPELPPGRTWTTVEFTDLRFIYSFMATRPMGRAPLGGWTYIVDAKEEAGEGLGQRVQQIR
jgi:inner membrane protein